jgi:hypothetical protein
MAAHYRTIENLDIKINGILVWSPVDQLTISEEAS